MDARTTAGLETGVTFRPLQNHAVSVLELLRIARNLQDEGIKVVICGGWVPFLKELARENDTAHSMSFDIDLMLREEARGCDIIDRIGMLLTGTLDFKRSNTTFRYEKTVEDNVVQLDLLADLQRTGNDEPVIKIHGVNTSLDLCMVDGAEKLGDHVEVIQINWDRIESCNISKPDQVGFLLLKTEVCRFREKSKDPYDIYYYCSHSEDPELIRQRLQAAIAKPAIRRTVDSLQRMFQFEDSKWVELILDHMNIVGDDRDREARFIVRAITRVVEGL
ncbi:MAG: hypothetical protein ABSC47_08940 [Terracidiphilus sp.]